MNKLVDTNILVRIMTNDIADKATEAIEQIESHSPGELRVDDVVLVELFFVLEHHAKYRFKRETIAELFRAIVLPTPQFKFGEFTTSAFEIFATHPELDYVDCLLAAKADSLGFGIMTFDQELNKSFSNLNRK